MIKLKHLKFNFTNDEGKGQMPVRNKLKKIRLLSQSSSSSMILNLPKVKRGKFLFGDLKGFVEKVNRLHRVIVLKRVCNEYKEYNNTLRNKSVFIRDNNISMLKYKQSLQRAYDVFKMEYEYNIDYEDLENWSNTSRYDEHYAKIYEKCKEIIARLVVQQ